MENNKDNVFNEANHVIGLYEAKQGLKQMKDFIPMIVEFNKNMHDEMVEQGFTEQQAFQFSCEYTLRQFIQK